MMEFELSKLVAGSELNFTLLHGKSEVDKINWSPGYLSTWISYFALHLLGQIITQDPFH